jgi:hypothetical protein
MGEKTTSVEKEGQTQAVTRGFRPRPAPHASLRWYSTVITPRIRSSSLWSDPVPAQRWTGYQ